MDRDYKYAILNGQPTYHGLRTGGGRIRLRYWIIIFLGVLVALGTYFTLVTNSLGFDTTNTGNPKLLLVSVDALRYDIRDKAPTPNLDWIAQRGVSVGHMINVFPTFTLPNHQSIVTGLYSEHHGVVGNNMYDKQTKEKFTMSGTQASFWNDAVPIWIENELQGHKSGVCYYPGYDVLFGGKQASFVPPTGKYGSPLASKKLMPDEERIELVVDWLQKPDVNFAALYFGHLDTLMHKIGPDPVDEHTKKQLRKTITNIDTLIGKLMNKLKRGNLTQVNVIIVGDHGQSNTNKTTKVVDVTSYVDLLNLAYSHGDGHIYAKPGQTRTIYKKLKEAEKKEGHFKVYLKKDIPDRYHIKNHPRTGDIFYVIEEGWALWTYGKLNRDYIKAGYHGYSTDVINMHPAFFAYGPVFQRGFRQDVVKMVDLYELMCHILALKPRKNDGSLENVKAILKAF